MQNEYPEVFWSDNDYKMGLCSTEQIGKLVDSPEQKSPADQQSAPPVEFKPLTKVERKRLLVEMSDKLLIAAHSDPMAFMGDAGPQINKFIDLASKLDSDDTPVLADLTARQLNALPTVERYRVMLTPVLNESPEVRERILSAWGLTPETIEALMEEMQDAV